MRAVPGRVPAAAVVVLALCSACAGAPDEAAATSGSTGPVTVASATALAAAALRPGGPVPAPDGDPVLVVSGRIARSNGAGVLALDLATLGRLGVSEVAVRDPWAEEDLRFRGVWLQDLLALADVAEGATTVHATALDDYTADIPIGEVERGGVLLATHDGTGAALPIEDGGPTRIVFAPGAGAGRDRDRWIWSLKSLEIR